MHKIARYFSLAGRTSRLGYWRAQVALSLLVAVVWCGGLLLADLTGKGLFAAIALLGCLPLIWVGVAVLFRRLHDRNKSGLWAVPFIVVPVLVALAGKSQLESLGAVAVILIALLDLVLVCWGFVEICLLSGTRGKNRFGADPRQAQSPLKPA